MKYLRQVDGLSVRELYPRISEGELKVAEETLRLYLEIALKIHHIAGGAMDHLDPNHESLSIKERSSKLKTESSEHG